MNQMMSLEFVITCAWKSSDLSITLIYWKDLNSSSLLDVKSYIYLREKLKVHKNNQNESLLLIS